MYDLEARDCCRSYNYVCIQYVCVGMTLKSKTKVIPMSAHSVYVCMTLKSKTKVITWPAHSMYGYDIEAIDCCRSYQRSYHMPAQCVCVYDLEAKDQGHT